MTAMNTMTVAPPMRKVTNSSSKRSNTFILNPPMAAGALARPGHYDHMAAGLKPVTL